MPHGVCIPSLLDLDHILNDETALVVMLSTSAAESDQLYSVLSDNAMPQRCLMLHLDELF